MDKWEAVHAVQKMQDHMEENIHNTVTLKDLARVAGYSPWHAARLFKELLGRTPFDYLRALRLSKAALELRDNDTKVIDVAFDFVFDSHEGFTKAFSKQFGVSPKRYSDNPVPIRLFMPHRIREYYLFLEKGEKIMNHEGKTKAVFVQVVERPERKMILLRGKKAENYFDYCNEVGCDVWGILTSIKEALYEPVGMWLPENMLKPGTSVYAQGVEVPVDYAGIVPDGFDLITLPACSMMVFQGEPHDDEQFMEAISEVWDIMKRYDPKVYGYEWSDQDAPRIQLEPQGYRGYIEARPVRPLNK